MCTSCTTAEAKCVLVQQNKLQTEGKATFSSLSFVCLFNNYQTITI